MGVLINLPLELLNLVGSNLDIADLFHLCSTCSYLRNVFRPDLVFVIVKNFCSDKDALEKAIAESSHLMLCHTLLHCFLEYGAYIDFAPLLQRKATLAAIPIGARLEDHFVNYGPWHRDTQFLLHHGASLDHVPEGISSLISRVVFDWDLELNEMEKRLDFLLESGATFRGMPSSFERLANELAMADLEEELWVGPARDRLVSVLQRGGPLDYAPEFVCDLLTSTYHNQGFVIMVECLLTRLPDALTMLLDDQVRYRGLGERLDDLIEHGASFEELPFGGSWEKLPGGHAAAMRAVLSGGAALRTKDECGNYPLYYLAGYGYVALLENAIERGAPVDWKSDGGVTALYIAGLRGKCFAVTALIAAGADPSIVNDMGMSPLHAAASRDDVNMARELIEGGAHLEAREKNGHTPLVQAVWRENVDMVQLLVDSGASIHATVSGWMLIFRAAHYGNISIVEIFLREGCDPSSVIGCGMTPIHAAAAQGHLECVQLLCSHGVSPMESQGNGSTAIHFAAQGGHTNVVRWLHELGTALDSRAHNGATALHFAAGANHDETVKWLLEHGAPLLETDNDNLTAFHRACQEGHLEMARLLLDWSVAIDALRVGGTTALGSAAKHGHMEVTWRLLEWAADRNLSMIPPLFLACSNDDPLAGTALLDGGADKEYTFSKPTAALQAASFSRPLEAIRMLLDAGGNLGAICGAGGDALECATIAGHDEIFSLLLDRGVSLHVRGDAGKLAIYIAAEHGWTEIVSLLLGHGSEVDAQRHGRYAPPPCFLERRI